MATAAGTGAGVCGAGADRRTAAGLRLNDPMDVVLEVPRRYRGPARSGNGGWTAGRLAAFLPGAPAVQVRLQSPPPLSTPMAVQVALAPDGSGRRQAEATAAGRTVLTAFELPDPDALLSTVPAVAFEAAEEAGARYAGLEDHPFPECFACGTGREPGDGLRLRPGPLGPGGAPGTAAAWIPGPDVDGGDGRVAEPTVWAALDCPGGWAVMGDGRPMVLGTITAEILQRPRVGRRHVVRAVVTGGSGRKASTASTLYDEDGTVLARALGVWLRVDPAAVQPLG